jgi:hypothetical protein
VREVAEPLETNRHLRELVAAARSAGIRMFIAPHRRWRPGDFEAWQRLSGPHIGIRDGRVFELGTWGGEFAMFVSAGRTAVGRRQLHVTSS